MNSKKVTTLPRDGHLFICPLSHEVRLQGMY